MEGQSLRIGLIGCGRWGRLILRDLLVLGADVVVVTPSAASQAAAAAAGAGRVMANLEQLGDVDGLVVAVPTSLHAEVVTSLLDRHVPIFVEKPLTADPESARRIAAAAPDRVFVMDKWRHLAGVRRLGELARSGALGRVTGLRTVRVAWGQPHTDVDCTWILAPHDLSIALEILGEVPTPVAAGVDDPAHVEVMVGFGRTTSGVWHNLEVSARAVATERRIEVIGTEAQATLAGGWDDRVTVVRRGGANPVEEVVMATGELPLLAELRAFLTHLAGGPPPVSSAAEGALIVEAIAGLRALAGITEAGAQ